MTATTDNVGVRVFSDLRNTTVSIDTRDSTAIGLVMPCPNILSADEAAIPLDEPTRISTEDTVLIAKMGAGLARDAITQIALEGISTDILFVRVGKDADIEDQIGLVAGSPTSATGVWALRDALSHLGIEPGLIITPGYDSQRLGNAANPVATAIDAVCDTIIDCMGIINTPETSREAAATYAQDFAASYNMIAMYPAAKVFLNGAYATRPLSPSVAAAIVRRDKEVGNPFKAAWNRPLKSIGGVSQRVTYQDGRTDHDANFLLNRGVGTVIENRLFWAPFTTATDPTTVGYRSIKRIRTRRSIEKALLRALRAYASEDIGPHLVTLLFQTLSEALEERQAVGALISGSEVIWDRKLNPSNSLRKGALRLKLRFEETPDLTDLGIYTEPQPEAYDVLTAQIQAAISSLGNPNLRFVA